MSKLGLIKIILMIATLIDIFLLTVFLYLKISLRKHKIGRLSVVLTLVIFLFCIPLFVEIGVIIDSLYIEPNWIQVEKVTIRIPRLAEALGGLKIVQISDLHASEIGFKEKSLIRIINSINPDIIFFTGGLGSEIRKRADEIKTGIRILGQLNPRLGIWAAPDNGDTFIFEDRETKKIAEDLNIHFLDNENTKIFTKPDTYFRLVGVVDPAESSGEISLNQAMLAVRLDEPKILIAHAPEIIYKAAKYGIDLVLVGHTHGGQCGIPWIRENSTYVKQYEKYISGLYKIKDTYLYVNRGIGVKSFEFRLLCRPEVTIIKIVD